MTKSSRKGSFKKHRRTIALAAIGIVAVGSAYAASAGDLVYGSKSLLAAVVGGIDTTPRIVISRNYYTPSGSIWPTNGVIIGKFDVTPRYLSYGYLRQVNTQITTQNSLKYDLRTAMFDMSYEYCSASSCGSTRIPVRTVTWEANSYGGTTFKIISYGDLNLSVRAEQLPTKILVMAYPRYPALYNNTLTQTASVKADVSTVEGAGQICKTFDGATSCTFGSVPVYTTLAYGNWLTVLRGKGYAYGYWDINNNGALTATDADMVLKVAVGTAKCAIFKQCDINNSGSVTATDSNLLLKYAVGSLPPPSTAPVAPDLIASAVTPTTATVGVSVALGAKVTNIGNASTGAGFPVIFQQTNSKPGTIPVTIGKSTAIALAGGTSQNVGAAYTFASAGTYYVRACADLDAAMTGSIVESNENNNCGPWTAVTVTSTPSPTPIMSVTAGPNASTCTAYSATTGNCSASEHRISFSVSAGGKDVYIGQGTTYVITPSGTAKGLTYALTTNSTQGVMSAITNVSVSPNVVGDTGTAYRVPANTSRGFTLIVMAQATGSGYTGFRLTGINYSTSATIGSMYYTSPLDTLKTNVIYMTK